MQLAYHEQSAFFDENETKLPSLHFAAFAAQDVDAILLDYTDDSQIIVYNQVDGGYNVFEGLSGVETYFTGLFDSLYDVSDLAAPLIEVEEKPYGQVFLIWSAAASGCVLVPCCPCPTIIG